MAEINIARTERSVWPWVVAGLALLAVLLWYLFARGGNDEVGEAAMASDTVAASTVAGASGAVDDYLRYTEESRARQAADQSHEYAADGIRRLAAALGEIGNRGAAGGADVGPQVDSLRQRAEDLQRNPQSTNHAAYARDAFVAAAGMMGSIQQRSYPNLTNEVAQVREAAEAVQPGRLLLEQRAEVQQFFDRSAAVLRAMTNATT